MFCSTTETCVAQALHVVSAHIHAADAHLARRYVVQAGNQVDQTSTWRCLCRP
ncbi:MAG: hypothetical protein ACLUHE_15735 [Christensenellales bacterium]